MRFCLILLLLLTGVAGLGYAQNAPGWIQSPPARTATYHYRVSKGTDLTEEGAERQAFAVAIMESALP
ncbi:MAG: hypothetical protein LUE99_13235 [Bacteroides sp.]|nr:hypothetical protein [Bacteroides sp.]